MQLATAVWPDRLGRLESQCRLRHPDADGGGSFQSCTKYYGLVLAALLVVGGVELNPGPNSQERCEMCGGAFGGHEDRERLLSDREAACLARERTLWEKEASFAARERTLCRKEATFAAREQAFCERAAACTTMQRAHGEHEVDSDQSVEVEVVTEQVVLPALELSAFHRAVEEGHLVKVHRVIQQDRVLANTKGRRGRSALHVAAEAGQVGVAQVLVRDAQADVEVQNFNGETALHCAASRGHLAVAKFLVHEAQADVRIETVSGWTALDLALSRKMRKLLRQT